MQIENARALSRYLKNVDSITCELNKKIVDFLNVRFSLNEQTYEPYRKAKQ